MWETVGCAALHRTVWFLRTRWGGGGGRTERHEGYKQRFKRRERKKNSSSESGENFILERESRRWHLTLDSLSLFSLSFALSWILKMFPSLSLSFFLQTASSSTSLCPPIESTLLSTTLLLPNLLPLLHPSPARQTVKSPCKTARQTLKSASMPFASAHIFPSSFLFFMDSAVQEGERERLSFQRRQNLSSA